jgi:hypothetical protein
MTSTYTVTTSGYTLDADGADVFHLELTPEPGGEIPEGVLKLEGLKAEDRAAFGPRVNVTITAASGEGD